MLRDSFLVMLFILFSAASGFSMAGKIENIPMKPYAKLNLKDGEVLRYKIERGGENVSEFKFVIILSNDSQGRYANIYHDGINVLKNEKYPDEYTNYIARFLISLDQATLLENAFGEKSCRTNILPRLDQKTPVTLYKKSVFDRTASEVFMESLIQRGGNLEYRKNRIKIKKGYPILDLGSGIVMGVRFLDITGPGIAIFVIPEILKEPLPVNFRFLGKEKVSTKAGDFNTIKIGFTVADTFLGQLMRSFTKETILWLEDSDRRILVKMKSPDNDFVLEEITNVKTSLLRN